jgi:glyoxylase-like metal-dependent hydrolase (beta-lactamase superfamily II)
MHLEVQPEGKSMFLSTQTFSIALELGTKRYSAITNLLRNAASTTVLAIFAHNTPLAILRCLLGSFLVAIVLVHPTLKCQVAQPDVTQKAIVQFEQKPLQTTSLGDGIYLFTGDGANVVAIADRSSTLVIDSGMESRTAELNSAVFSATHRPITQLVNTNWHFDHTGGNMFFGTSGVSIIAQNQIKTRLSSTRDVRYINLQDGPYPAQALPTITFVDHLELNQGTAHLRLSNVASAHTDGDTIVFLEPANMVVLGDIFSQPFYPVIDVNSGGSLQGIIDSVDKVLSATNERTRYVPGHGR